MTKTKSKKMTKSTFAIIIMAVVMVAMLAFGGTYAYFTATASEKTTSFSTGSVKLTSSGTFTASLADVVPGDSLTTGAITLTSTTEGTAAYLAIEFKLTATKDAQPVDLSGTSLETVTELLTEGWYSAGDNIYIWCGASGVGDGTPLAVATSTPVKVTDAALIFDADADWEENGEEPELMNADITITINARSVQSDNFTEPTAANIKAELFPGAGA